MFNFQKSSIFITSAYLCLSMCICSNSTGSLNELNHLITYNKTEIQIKKQSNTNNAFLDAPQEAVISEGGPSFFNKNKFKLNDSTTSGIAQQSNLLSVKPNLLNSSKFINSTAGNYSTQPIHQTLSNIGVNNTLWELSNTAYSNSTKAFNTSEVFVTEENVQKIVPRKGVEQTIVVDDISSTSSNNYPESSTQTFKDALHTNVSIIPFIKDVLKKNVSDYLVNETEQSNIKSFPPLSRKKSKPLITLDELKRNVSSVSAKPTTTTAKKNDYVIPVVAVILAVPLISVLVMFFYKKGTEFWERRHYRRMDFLIDGMYND